ncbi:MAG TPA: glycosyl hydrolase family 28-related protein [Herpetosiphonaceae bacterium]
MIATLKRHRWLGLGLLLGCLVLALLILQLMPQRRPPDAGAQMQSTATPSRATGPTVTSGPTSPPVPTLVPGSRGATVPWIEYEAESGSTNAGQIPTSRIFGQIASEASGRRAVQLSSVGQYVQFTSSQAANSIVVRYVIPDAPNGGGIDATISLYVDGTFRQKLDLTSRYAWSYGGETGSLNDPGAVGAHHFFDESRALVGDIPAGATVKLQKDGDDSAAYYIIDLIDLEQVGAQKTMPADFISIADCGATPDDGSDDGQAIQECINTARSQNKGVWIPAGTFDSNAQPQSNMGIAIADVTVRGAGMWYSTLRGPYARFHCTGDNCRFADFAILGETVTRDDKNPENGFNGGAGSGSWMDSVWVEHTKVGWWVGAGSQNVTDGLVIKNSRFRNLFADGVNFTNGTSNSIVENSHFRNTGDDALATWAPSFDGPITANNTFRFNTIQLPWRANCLAIYGGRDHKIQDNLCYDVLTYPGILIAQEFDAHPFGGTIRVERNSLVRAGGPMWSQQHGALKINSAQGPISGLVVDDLIIDSPTYSGIHIQGPANLSNITLGNIYITNPGSYGILINRNATGGATFNGVSVSNPIAGGLRDETNGTFALTRGTGNSGW